MSPRAIEEDALLTSRVHAELAALQTAIGGQVILPDSPAYEEARKPAFAQYASLRPAAIVRCSTPADVVEAIALVQDLGLTIATRSGGHCFAGRSTTRGLVIDLSPLCSVELHGTVATIGAGATLGAIYGRLENEGRTIAAGSCPTVGIAGLTLGGGLGIFGRTYGLTSDQLLEAQVVLADGRVADCDAQRYSDLFWALRGAGAGQFGVVTRFVFKTVPVEELTCFRLGWPLTAANAVLEAWQAWAPEAPNELAASLLLNTFGDVDRPPAVTLFGAGLGAKGETASLVDQLAVRAVADPVSSSLEQLPYKAARRFLSEHTPGVEQPATASGNEPPPNVVFNRSEFFRKPLPRGAIEALVAHFAAGRVHGQARELDLTPWGGAYNRVQAHATAFAHRNERFLLKHAVSLAGAAMTSDRDRARAWLSRSWALAHRYGSGGVFPNFAEPELDAWTTAYHRGNRNRLLQVKARYDPENVFRFDHVEIER
jgi:FAD binding domain/Berberine and berberine like